MSGASLMKVLLVTCIVEREHVGIPVAVPEYEVAVLQEIHGEMGVREVGEQEVELPAITAAQAYAQLQSKYRGHTKEVRQVYRSVRELARHSGLAYKPGDDEAVKFQEGENTIGGKKVEGGRPIGRKAGGKGKAPVDTGESDE